MARPLTRRQLEVLQAIATHQTHSSLSPTLEELGSSMGINRVTVYGHVQALLQKGHLENLEPGASRGLEITIHGKSALAPIPVLQSTASSVHDSGVPLLGKIAAGQPLEAIENPSNFDWSNFGDTQDSLFMLEVHGDSMIEDHIQEGDLVLVRSGAQPHPGDTVVAIVENNEATLKRFYPEPDGRIRLQPANSALQPTWPSSLEIRGVVAGVVRRYS